MAASTVAALVSSLGTVAAVSADGALPNSLGVLLPSDHPDTLMIATNFGLLSSEDGGTHWKLVCEQVIGSGAALYQLGRSPEDEILTVTVDGLSRSDDLGCSWKQTFLDRISDAFPDPNDAKHVLAIARAAETDGGTAQAVFESTDGGASFETTLFVAAENAYVTGLEIARSDSKTIYVSLTEFETKNSYPYLVRSKDGGRHWKKNALEASVGMQLPRILAVDADDAERVYLRLGSTGKDQLGIYDDTTGEVTVVLSLKASMSAFLRRSDGTLIVASADGKAFLSKQGGTSFTELPNGPHLRGLGERAGKLYAATDTLMDGFAVAVSKNDGGTWTPVLSFDGIEGLRSCGSVPSECAASWTAFQMSLAMPTSSDPEFDAGPVVSSSETPKKNPRKASSGCTVAEGSSAHCSAGLAGWLLMVAVLFVVRRTKRTFRQALLVCALAMLNACGSTRPRYRYVYSTKGGAERVPVAHRADAGSD
jgi:photosystem II stability/assembly factor-like uncharacterized protein